MGITKVNIYLIGMKEPITIFTRLNYQKFVFNLFKKKIYMSIPEDNLNIVSINTENITCVWDDKTPKQKESKK